MYKNHSSNNNNNKKNIRVLFLETMVYTCENERVWSIGITPRDLLGLSPFE